ncbi:MAG TPA: hypothetical protein VGX92_00630 [Pyrinomonadaceae bacterium]|jgi:hypothetical protein|nr:hypothetical protein [Pyrinomonadaceae bacterium]
MAITSKKSNGKVLFPTSAEGAFESIIYGADVAVTVSYDASKVPQTGPYAYMTNKGADGGITFVAGQINLNPGMDNGGSTGWPIIQFRDGKFTGIDYYHSFDADATKYVFRAQGLLWEITEKDNRRVMASGQISPNLS